MSRVICFSNIVDKYSLFIHRFRLEVIWPRSRDIISEKALRNVVEVADFLKQCR